MIVEATDQNFDALVRDTKTPLLVDFWASWCGPCRVIAPLLKQLDDEYAGGLTVGKLDVDANPVTAERYGVRSIPMLALFAGGELRDTLVGARPKDQIRAFIDQHSGLGPKGLSPAELEAAVRAGAAVYDVRPAADHQRARIAGSQSRAPAELIAGADDLEERLVLVCRTGDESRRVAAALVKAGAGAAFLDGGILGWEASGRTLEK